MSQESTAETERVVVQTYVPQYQRDAWDEQADEMDMNRSEFIRTMVQAGRQVYADDQLADTPKAPGTQSEDEAASAVPAQSDDSLRELVTSLLESEGCLDWEALLTMVSGDIETRLEDALEALQAENRVKYSGRQGGYILQEDTDE